MKQFKIDLFEQDSEVSFPNYYSLSKGECASIREKLLFIFPESRGKKHLSLVEEILLYQKHIEDVNANDDFFCLDEVFRNIGIKTNEDVYLNWYQYDEIDRFKLNDLLEFFNVIWYPSSDDLDLFDDSLSWIISIRHDGQVFVANNF